MAIQNLRSSSAHKRPIPNVLSAGQIAVNTNQASPGLFFKDSNGDLVKVGPVHIGTAAPNSSPATTAADALVSGTVYQILTLGNTDFTAVGASANTVGVVFTATGAGTGTGTVSGQQGNEKGEQWLDTTSGYDLKIYDGSAWRSQAGEFVNVTGDTMTGALGVVAGSASAPGVFFSGDTNTGLLAPAADSVAITTGGTQRIVVDSSGRLGIGTTSPATTLEVQSASNTSIRIDNEDDSTATLVFHNTGSTDRQISVVNGEMTFGGSSDEQMRIDSSGRLLVGTSTGDGSINKFQVTGNTAGNTGGNISLSRGAIPTAVNQTLGFISFGDGGGDIYAQVKSQCDGAAAAGDAPGRLVFLTTADGDSSPTERMRIDRSGTISLGNLASPASANIHLDLYCNSSYDAFIRFRDQSGAPGLIGFDHGSNAMQFYTNGASEAMRIDGSGNVGIGVSDPSAGKLVVTASSNGGFGGSIILENSNNSDTDKVAIAFRPNGSATTAIGSYGEARIIGEYDSGSTNGSNNLQFWTHAGNGTVNERMRINSAGNVGIGTSSPDQQLTIKRSGGQTQVSLISDTTQSGAIYFGDTASTSRGVVRYDHNGDFMRLYTAGSEQMRIDSSGRLLLNGGTDVRMELGTTGTTGTNNRNHIRGDGSSLKYNTCSGGLHIFEQNGSERMQIDSSGNVGIGTSSPSASIHLAVSDPQFRLQRTGAYSTSSGPLIQFQGKGPNGVNYNFGKIQAVSSGSNNAGELQFFTNNAGSQSERMRIDSSGRLLVGTSSARSNTPLGGAPAALIERVADSHSNADLMLVNNSASGYYPKLIFGLSQASSAGSNALVGSQEALGYIQFTGNDGSSFIEAARIAAVTDGATGANDMPGRLAFYVTQDGASSPTERMRLGNDGTLRTLMTGSAGRFHLATTESAGTTILLNCVHSRSGINSGGTASLRIYSDGDVENTNNSYSVLSDEKLKENIVDANSQWDDIKSLRIRKFNFKEETGNSTHTQIGVIAQEVELVSPGLVKVRPASTEEGEDSGDTVKTVNSSVLYMKAVKALQEAMTRIETLEQRLSDAGIA